jgi:preprotein translocase subunit YajC
LVLLPVLFVGAIYFFIWRPQQRRIAAVRQLQAEIEEGDEVLTTSGIYGTIVRLGDSDADLEIAEGTIVHVARGAIGQRVTDDAADHEAEPHDGEQGAD